MRRAASVQVQRWIKVGPHDVRVPPRDLDRRFREWLGKKRIRQDTQKAILAQATAWIQDENPHLRSGEFAWTSYGQLFDAIRRELGTSAPASEAEIWFEPPSPTPMSPASDPIDFEQFAEDVVPRLRKEASFEDLIETETGSSGGTIKYKSLEKYRARAGPYYRRTSERRKYDRSGTLSDASEPTSFGGLPLEIQGGTSHRLVPRGGGPAPPYDVLLDRLAGASGGWTEAQIGSLLVGILQKGDVPPPETPAGAWEVLRDIFAIVRLAELARASLAPMCFLAAAHQVARGTLRLKQAFEGATAVYLGAGKGGAAALRGTIASLQSEKQRTAMTAQEGRAALAIAEYLAPFISKQATDEELDARLRELNLRVLLNLMRFEGFLLQRYVRPPLPEGIDAPFESSSEEINRTVLAYPGVDRVAERYTIHFVSGEYWLCFIRAVLLRLGLGTDTMIALYELLRGRGVDLATLGGRGVEMDIVNEGAPRLVLSQEATAILAAIEQVTGRRVRVTLIVPQAGEAPVLAPADGDGEEVLLLHTAAHFSLATPR